MHPAQQPAETHSDYGSGVGLSLDGPASDHIRRQNRREFPGLRHGSPRREDFTANSRSWLDHAVSLDLEGREIGVPHHRWRRVKLPKPLQTEKRL